MQYRWVGESVHVHDGMRGVCCVHGNMPASCSRSGMSDLKSCASCSSAAVQVMHAHPYTQMLLLVE